MKKFNKIVSVLLAVLMLMGSFSLSVFAADENPASRYEYDTNRITLDYMKGQVLTYNEDGKVATDPAGKNIFLTDEAGNPVVVDTAAERLEYMDLRLEKDGHRLYIDAYTGEIAVENIATGETLFSNPYDVGATTSTDSIKAQLLSQIVVKYTDISQNNAENTFYSYTEAAKRGQIDIKNIKNGIRVEYSIGREQSKMLVPMLIEKEAFETKIVEPLKEAMGETSFEFRKFMSFYSLFSKDTYFGEALDAAQKKYPIFKQMDFYIIDDSASEIDIARMEQNVKTYAPDYTFDDLDEDHLKTGYESEDANPPLFRMALEYTIDAKGLSVRLPSNGIRFNETLYRLKSVDILPYMGAAANPGEGYSFFPDGSGTLFDFEKIQQAGSTTTVTSKVYGQDFAYHTITGKHQEDIRYPVFGMVDTYDVIKETGAEFVSKDYAKPDDYPETAERKRGFVAIIEEGDAMMEITTYHETKSHKYNAVKVSVYPRPQDTYNVADAISVGSNSEWTVVSSRKYTGSYRIRYMMLTPEEARADAVGNAYDCSYVGMAVAYRDYLIEKGVLNKLTANDVKEDIPLYIETFGAIPTTEKILSIPVTVMTPLTSFEDIESMYSDFSNKGITNINFILTGYNDGGMYSGVDYSVDFEKAVGGNRGFEKLVETAKEKGFGIYPDFDFTYHSNDALFDGVTLKKHLVKTIDNRYANKREYSATKQMYLSFFELIISPAYFNHFYEHLTEDYIEFDPIGISVSTLGNSLNSDFDEKEPYNREDAKKYTVEAFEYLDEKYDSVMTSEGNSFTWKYVDHITDIALDSSRYSQAGAAVPFLGIVLHGYIQTAGTPINMEGNIEYALLKAIENGASLKFILSRRNTETLKNSGATKNQKDLSTYYSIRYDIWFDDVVSIYNELNSLLAGVQTSAITNHRFIDGTRIPDGDEIVADAKALIDELVALEAKILAEANDKDRATLLAARLSILDKYDAISKNVTTIESYCNTLVTVDKVSADGSVVKAARLDQLKEMVETYKSEKKALDTLNAELAELEKDAEANADAIKAKTSEITTKTREVNKAFDNAKKLVNDAYTTTNRILSAVDSVKVIAEDARASYEILAADGTTNAELLNELKTKVESLEKTYAEMNRKADDSVSYSQNSIFKAVDGVLEGIVKYEKPVATETVVEETKKAEAEVTNKYASDDDRIAYVEYENGTAFLLNFNDYAVRTELNGTIYKINAYDYLVVNMAN